MKVPGRKTIVNTAIVFMDELSLNVASAISCIYKLSFLEDSAILMLA